MNLGLDLKGGMNVILEVSVKDVLKGLVANAQDPRFTQAIANTDEAQKSRSKQLSKHVLCGV